MNDVEWHFIDDPHIQTAFDVFGYSVVIDRAQGIDTRVGQPRHRAGIVREMRQHDVKGRFLVERLQTWMGVQDLLSEGRVGTWKANNKSWLEGAGKLRCLAPERKPILGYGLIQRTD